MHKSYVTNQNESTTHIHNYLHLIPTQKRV